MEIDMEKLQGLLRLKVQDGFREEIACLSRSELLALFNLIREHKLGVSVQLQTARTKARETGEFAPQRWYTNALYFESSCSAKMGLLQVELTRRKHRRARTYEQSFIEAARQMLDREVYVQLVDAANAITGAKEL